jgi:hypothetical protein
MAKGKNPTNNEQLSLRGEEELILRSPSHHQIRKRFSDLETCLASPALLSNEKPEDFEALFNQLLLSVIPSDAIEYIYIRDAAILTFDINRLQRSKIALVKTAYPQAVSNLVAPALDRIRADQLSGAWTRGAPEATSQVNEILKKRGLKQEAIQLKAIELRLDRIQKIESMISVLESRRFAFFREIDRHRDGFKRRLQEAVKNADGSYSVVEAENNMNSQARSSSQPSTVAKSDQGLGNGPATSSSEQS